MSMTFSHLIINNEYIYIYILDVNIPKKGMYRAWVYHSGLKPKSEESCCKLIVTGSVRNHEQGLGHHLENKDSFHSTKQTDTKQL